MKGESTLTPSQIQATRLNELEHRRLRQNLHLLQEDYKSMLDRIQREAHDLKDHYTNVVRVVKPNPKYDLWKEYHANEIVQNRIPKSSGLFSSEKLFILSLLLIDRINKNQIECSKKVTQTSSVIE